MPVRVRLAVKSHRNNAELEVIALVNTGFTSDAPDIALPVPIAERLGLWPAPEGSVYIAVETCSGSMVTHIVPRALSVRVVTEDRTSREVEANALVSPYITEALISDALAEELGVQILYPRKGLWKFADEEKVRGSACAEFRRRL